MWLRPLPGWLLTAHAPNEVSFTTEEKQDVTIVAGVHPAWAAMLFGALREHSCAANINKDPKGDQSLDMILYGL